MEIHQFITPFMARKKKDSSIDEYPTTTEGGYIDGVYHTKAQADAIAKMVRTNLDHMKNTIWANKQEEPSVKRYIEDIEGKIKQALKIVNFMPGKK